jgi:two-component system sensor histidine kinase KdpD
VSAAQAEAVIRLEVWDEGPGQPAGQEHAVFARFAHGQKESFVSGVGLGLGICEAVVKAHEGKIWAEQRLPQGVRFIFTLPLDEQPVVEDEAGL